MRNIEMEEKRMREKLKKELRAELKKEFQKECLAKAINRIRYIVISYNEHIKNDEMKRAYIAYSMLLDYSRCLLECGILTFHQFEILMFFLK